MLWFSWNTHVSNPYPAAYIHQNFKRCLIVLGPTLWEHMQSETAVSQGKACLNVNWYIYQPASLNYG